MMREYFYYAEVYLSGSLVWGGCGTVEGDKKGSEMLYDLENHLKKYVSESGYAKEDLCVVVKQFNTL